MTNCCGYVRCRSRTAAVISDVATTLHNDVSTVSRQVSSLVTSGLLEKSADLDDGSGSLAATVSAGGLRLECLGLADETTAPVLDPGRGRTKTGQLWAYARDDRPFGGADPPIAVHVAEIRERLARLSGESSDRPRSPRRSTYRRGSVGNPSRS